MTSLQIVSDVKNSLLERREIKCLFRSGAGLITRAEAIKAVTKKLRLNESKLVLISLSGRAGSRDVEGLLFFYADRKEAERQLPAYLFTRMLPKEERKRLLEEAKKAKPAKKT